jgi:NADH-quinone oxidoreductase subunit N
MGNIAFLPIAPEVVLLAGAVLVLILEVTLNLGRRVWAGLAALSVIVATGFSVVQWFRVDAIGPQLHYAAPTSVIADPMVVMDHFSAFAGIAIIGVAGLALLSAWDLVAKLETRGAEFVALVLLAIAGLHMMAISANLIMLFMGLETASIALYVVAGFTRERRSADEAAVKYFLLGSFASAIFLYGIALIFASTGTTSIYGAGGMRAFFSGPFLVNNGVLLAGIALMLVGLGFKVSAAPFHQWAPDVYQGAPTGAVAFMAAGVKVAGFAAIGRVLVGALPNQIDDWAPAIAVMAALSVVIGTLLAIAQTDLKRMLAYSGVAHAGFLLTGVVAGLDGMPAMWFYVSTYAVQLVAAFTVVAVVSGPRSGASPLDDYNGLSVRSPALAASLAVMMLAMGGIPFTTGFVGKFSVFTVAINSGYLWLAITGLVSSVAGLFFYLRVVVRMYIEQPAVAGGPGTLLAEPRLSWSSRTVLGLSVAITLILGIVPWPLLNWVRNALPL